MSAEAFLRRSGSYAGLASLSARYPPLMGRSATCSSAVRHSPEGACDLHALGTPPAFVLSQDQTRRRDTRSRRYVGFPGTKPTGMAVLVVRCEPPTGYLRTRCQRPKARHTSVGKVQKGTKNPRRACAATNCGRCSCCYDAFRIDCLAIPATTKVVYHAV